MQYRVRSFRDWSKNLSDDDFEIKSKIYSLDS